jgi:hypothetical protein
MKVIITVILRSVIKTYNVAGVFDNGRPQHAREEKSCEEERFWIQCWIDSEEQQETKM